MLWKAPTGVTDAEKRGPWLLLFLEFVLVLITLCFAIILAFCISVTTAPMTLTCFITYSQLIILACYHSWPYDSYLDDVVFTDTGTLHSVSKVFLTLYGVATYTN